MFLKVQLAKLQPPRKSPDARKSDQFLLIYSKAITREETVKKLQICRTCRKLFIFIFLTASLCIFSAMDVYCV